MAANEPENIIDVEMRKSEERWMNVMEKLEEIIVENGITYVLGEDDIYLSLIHISEPTRP